ncbi:phage head closure protein [Clostridium tagluense]|uniref:phage head closure protein n=1 Tax=Clostridium tagluense TaxID=360422 RepID=UPI001CF4EA3E|nr:phage head closure protein [Clostridium tagluense]MCB2300652.1 phage head closure protein [Clostridium tagluense]
MEIGKLNNRITFQKLENIVNENGFNIETWVNINTVWASATNLHGREFYSAMAVQSEKTVKFGLRYMKNLDTSMRIVFGKKTVNILDGEGNITGTKEVDKQFNITAIDNIKYDNTFMEIQALEVII